MLTAGHPERFAAADVLPPSLVTGPALDSATLKYGALGQPSAPYVRIDQAGFFVWQSFFRDGLDVTGLRWGFYDDLLVRDGHAGSVFRKRVGALTSLPIRVRPARHLSHNAEAKARAARTEQEIFGIRQISRSIALLAETWLLKGFAPTQIVPAPRKGALRIRVEALQWLDPTMVFFNLDGQMWYRRVPGSFVNARNLTAERPGQFFAPAYRGTPMNPQGIGLGEDLLRPFWLTIEGGVRAWAAGCERLGIPIRDVSVPPEIANDKAKYAAVKKDAVSLNRDAVFVHDERVKLTLANANTVGMADTFDKFVRYCDEVKSKICLGETLTTDTAVRGSSEIAGGHREARQELRDADAAALAEWLTEHLVAFIERVNDGVDDPADFSQLVIGDEVTAPRGADLTALLGAYRDARLAGAPVTAEAYYRLGVEAPQPGEAVLPPPSAPLPAGDPLQFAAAGVPAHRRALEDAAVRPLVPAYRALLEDITGELRGKA